MTAKNDTTKNDAQKTEKLTYETDYAPGFGTIAVDGIMGSINEESAQFSLFQDVPVIETRINEQGKEEIKVTKVVRVMLGDFRTSPQKFLTFAGWFEANAKAFREALEKKKEELEKAKQL